MVSLPERPALCLTLIALACAACFKADDGDDEIGDTTETSTTDTTETTSGPETDTTESSDGPQPLPPTIDLFTVAGSESPAEVTAAGAVEIVVEASDADGEIAMVELLHEGDVIATIAAPGPYVGEFVIGGESFDGSHDFTARAVDDEGLEVVAGPITLDVNVPNGGLVETWTYDGGSDDLVYRVWAGPNGNQVVAAGASTVDGAASTRIDRVVGPLWADTLPPNGSPASGIVGLANGEFAAVSWFPNTSLYFRFDGTGALTSTTNTDWPPANVPPENFEAPLDLAADAEGNSYATGIFATGFDYDTFMLRRFEPDGSEGWKVYGINPMTYPVPPYAVRLDVAGETIVVAGQLRQADPPLNTPWLARFSTDGGLIDQITTDFEGIVWGVGIGDSGDFIVGGARFVDPQSQAWAARYDAQGNSMWIDVAEHPGIGAVIAADIDPFGDSVLVALVDCEAGFLSTLGCDLYVRKHDPQGTLIWEQAFDDDGFLGPSLIPISGDLHFDRFGYAYVAISHAGPNMNADWWITKFNP